MNGNEGTLDRAIRVILGITLITWGVMNQNWLGAIGAVPLLTGLLGWCPLYSMLGINSACKTKID